MAPLLPHRLVCLALLSLFFSPSGFAADNLDIVKRWLATNSGVKSLQIDFTQTRTMRSLKVPIRQTGTLWLDHSHSRFRWQVGDPPQTIVVKPHRDLIIIRTPMKKYEKRSPGTGDTPAMAALAKGFPRTLEEFQRKYRVLQVEPRDNTYRIVAAPLGADARGVQSFTYVVESRHFRLVGIEIDLKDGSSVETVFNKVVPNAPVPLSLFQPSLEGYRETTF
ncbi:MAG: outer membrane lipoprotein carrier protein LolA [Verrucomicrobiales bacterium]|nr:outer membrane lipoprotein carrier protein LolA [Verrucomicrobiales bacterium]